jgi:hypothetical protein
MAKTKETKNHDTIRKWVEARGGRPATVSATIQGDEAGLLRVDFPGYSGEETLEAIEWSEFFDKFAEENLAFLYQEQTESGDTSRFCKFVAADE